MRHRPARRVCSFLLTLLVCVLGPAREVGAQAAPLAPGAPPLAPEPAATLDVVTNVAGATVRVDGREVTRWPASVARGEHRVEVNRDGFEPYARAVTVGAPGARLVVELDWARAIPRAIAARLQVLVAEPAEVRALLGTRRLSLDGGEAVPPGRHRLRVSRAGYLTADAEVTLPPSRTSTVAVTLAPDVATLARRALLQRVVGGALMGLGLAGAVSAGVWLGTIETADAPLQMRYRGLGNCTAARTPDDVNFCRVQYPSTNATLSETRTSSALLIGAGLAVAAVGAVVAFTAPRASPRDRSTLELLAGPDGVAVSGAF